MSGRVAVVGGGIAGLTAAYELRKMGREFLIFEAGGRWGGVVETTGVGGFVLEGGADSWVTEKPWARELAEELGLGMVGSNDRVRRTYVVRGGALVPLPDGMRMMVPTDLGAMRASGLFSDAAKQAYEAEVGRAEELRAGAVGDESVAAFVGRHFGEEVCTTVAGPMLAGILGGDVERLSVRAVLPQFVRLEREFGSLILGLQAPIVGLQARAGADGPVFTTLRGGMQVLVDALVARLPVESLRLRTVVTELARDGDEWLVNGERFAAVVLAVPAEAARRLLAGIDAEAAELLRVESSSAVSVALGFAERVAVPEGFGFLGDGGALLACTFVDQKFPGRAPEGGSILRAFFGDGALLGESDVELVARARRELEALLGELPMEVVSSVRRWANSMPQYAVGHLERMDLLDTRVAKLPGLKLIGNAYRGVGIPDLVRAARVAAGAV